MEPETITNKCEFCGGEYKNLSVHQRFCKAKKEALEESTPIKEVEKIAEEAKIEQEVVSKELEPTPEGEGSGELADSEEITQKQIDLVEKTLEGTEALSTEDKKDEEVVPDDSMKEAMKDAGVKVKDESLIIEQEPKVVFKEELVIEFNEPQDIWETKLCDIFKQVDSGREVHIKLKGQLSHEFTTTDGTVRYPSDVFINAIRTFCSNFRDELNNYGGQTFICRRK